MGKHCKTFQTISDYDSFKSSDDFILPNISYIYENESVDFNPDTSIDYSNEYFTIEALEDGLTAQLSNNACEYRIDDDNWNTLSADSNTPSINKGQTVSFKGNLTPI